MNQGDLLLLRGGEIRKLFRGREARLVETVKEAYLVHREGDVSVPNCPFLRFPDNERDRIIAKPAYLGGGFRRAGIKWIASFPRNLDQGIERASATLILNSPDTGVPVAILESSVISAARTAASAALAATALREQRGFTSVGIVGCGLINFETLRFLLELHPQAETVYLYDLDERRVRQYRDKSLQNAGTRDVRIVDRVETVFREADVVSVATTAIIPHLDFPKGEQRPGIILHISLRDFTPEVILAADNVVDDVEHVCSNQTSLHLAMQKQGNHKFIRATLGAILAGEQPARAGTGPVIFSPFGLGILDLALAHVACQLAEEAGVGTRIKDFLPTPWTEQP